MILQLSLLVAVSLTYEQLLHPLQTGKYHLDTMKRYILILTKGTISVFEIINSRDSNNFPNN